jgi:hypothetical protein
LDPDKKVGGYQITLPNPAGGILDRLHAGYPKTGESVQEYIQLFAKSLNRSPKS